MDSKSVSCKTKFNDDFRRFALQLEPFPLMPKLQATVSELYSISPTSFLLQYSDEEGDLITVKLDEELLEAILVARQLSPPPTILRLLVKSVNVKDTDSTNLNLDSNQITTIAPAPVVPLPAIPEIQSLLKLIKSTRQVQCEQGRFQSSLDFEARKTLGRSMKDRYNDSVPVIVQRMSGSKAAVLPKMKYLIPYRTQAKEFVKMIQDSLVVSDGNEEKSENNVILYVEGLEGCYYNLMDETLWMGKIYAQYKMEDCFLYVIYLHDNEELVAEQQ